jgi:hypothetical protein
MPVLHGYKNSPGKFYVKTAIERRPLTVQLRQQAIECLTGNRADWSPSLPKYGLKDGERFDQSLLVFLFRKGWAFTRGGGPGEAMSSWRLVFGDLPGKMLAPRVEDVIEVEEGEDLPSTLRNTARLQFWLRIRCEGADCIWPSSSICSASMGPPFTAQFPCQRESRSTAPSRSMGAVPTRSLPTNASSLSSHRHRA